MRTDLPGGTGPSLGGKAASIYVSGGTVFTAGRYFNGTTTIACYWSSTARTDFGAGAASSIFISRSTVYIAGSESGACYWANGMKTDLPPEVGSCANSIFVP